MGQNGFQCATCGKWHDGIPDLHYPEPFPIEQLSAEERAAEVEGEREDDFRIRHCSGTTDYFLRVLLPIPIPELKHIWRYGVWTSLSEKSCIEANRLYEVGEGGGPFFGYLCNRIAGFPDTLSLECQVHGRAKLRGMALLEPTDHPLALAQRNGLSLERVLELVQPVLHPG